MPPIIFKFNGDIVYKAAQGMGLAPRTTVEQTYLALCNSLSGSTFTWDAAADFASVIATELPEGNGYARIPLSVGANRAITVAAATGVITVTGGHTFADGEPVFIFNSAAAGSIIIPLAFGTIYFVRDADPVAGTLRLARTPGGTALTFVGTATTHFIAYAGNLDASRRFTSLVDSATIRAGSAPPGLNFTDLVLIQDAPTAWANRVVSAVVTGTGATTSGQITTTVNHTLTTADRIFFTAAPGATLPTPTGAVSLANNQAFGVLTPSTNIFRITADGTNPITFTSGGSGLFFIRNARGRIVSCCRGDTEPANLPINIAPGQMMQFTSLSTMQAA
jgi:hypothetical protein